MTTAPIINPTPIPPDTRPIAEMHFMGGDETRAFLTRCSVTEAREIETLGCTGATKFGLSVDEIRVLRLGLAGGGVGLPCFIAPSRYCLAHNTIGGLQNEQLQRYPEFAEQISRPLTKQEAGHVAYTEAVRHSTDASAGVGDRIASASGMLNGYGDMPRGTEMVEEEEPATPEAQLPPAAQAIVAAQVDKMMARRAFRCDEHTTRVWTCRFCVAQAVADGEMEPVFAVRAVSAIDNAEVTTGVLGSELDEAIEKLNTAEVKEVEIYVLVKTLTRRLA